MDYREEQFLRMQQSDTPKVPFYMSYPMQNLYLTEMEYEKDMDRMKELYPRDVSRMSAIKWSMREVSCSTNIRTGLC